MPPGRTHRMPALLGQAGVVEHQHTTLGCKPSHQRPEPKHHRGVILRTLINEPPQGLVVAARTQGEPSSLKSLPMILPILKESTLTILKR
jgi:hypothetical protein